MMQKRNTPSNGGACERMAMEKNEDKINTANFYLLAVTNHDDFTLEEEIRTLVVFGRFLACEFRNPKLYFYVKFHHF